MNKYYRGGPTLVPRRIDVIINRKSGLLSPTRGVSVLDRPDGLERFGGAYELGSIPDSLKIVQAGKNPHHFEIAPAYEMTFETYQSELAKISLTPV